MYHRTATPRPPRNTRRRRGGGAAPTVGVLAAAGGAFSYWTGTGSGSGSATTKTGVSAVTVNQTVAVTDLAPGSGTQPLSGTFDNANSGPVYISAVSATVTVTKASGAPAGTCDATDYTLAGTSTVPGQVPAGTGQGTWSGLTIAFNNKAGVNQDACKGAAVAIAYTAS